MNLFVTIILGSVIGGGFGYFIMGGSELLLANMITGLVGAIIGDALYYFVLISHAAGLPFFSPTGGLCCVVGALVVTLLFDALHRSMPKHIAHESHVEEEGSVDEED